MSERSGSFKNKLLRAKASTSIVFHMVEESVWVVVCTAVAAAIVTHVEVVTSCPRARAPKKALSGELEGGVNGGIWVHGSLDVCPLPRVTLTPRACSRSGKLPGLKGALLCCLR